MQKFEYAKNVYINFVYRIYVLACVIAVLSGVGASIYDINEFATKPDSDYERGLMVPGWKDIIDYESLSDTQLIWMMEITIEIEENRVKARNLTINEVFKNMGIAGLAVVFITIFSWLITGLSPIQYFKNKDKYNNA